MKILPTKVEELTKRVDGNQALAIGIAEGLLRCGAPTVRSGCSTPR